jgi:hypothetical protein
MRVPLHGVEERNIRKAAPGGRVRMPPFARVGKRDAGQHRLVDDARVAGRRVVLGPKRSQPVEIGFSTQALGLSSENAFALFDISTIALSLMQQFSTPWR